MGSKTDDMACENTDRELWREPTTEVGLEYYQPSIHVTLTGGIGIDVGGRVFVKTLREWHALALEKHGWPSLHDESTGSIEEEGLKDE